MLAVRHGLTHIGLFYSTDADLLSSSVRFVEDGLSRREPVLVAQPPQQLRRLAGALGDSADGVAFVDMSVAGRNPGRILPWVLHDFALRHPGRPVRIIGEPIWPGRPEFAYPACVQYEALINVVLDGVNGTLLCPYDAARLPRRAVTDAYLTHPLVAHGQGAVTASADYTDESLAALTKLRLDRPPGSARSVTFSWQDLARLRQIVAIEASPSLTTAQVAKLQLAVTEAATNAVVHGGGGGTLRLWYQDGHLVVDVHSAGPFDNHAAGRLRPMPESPGGRGLALINHVCDLVHWSYERDHGTNLRMWMRTAN